MIVSAVLFIIVGVAAVDADDINVALNKPANLSNQYTVSYPDVTADKAVDGNTNQDFNNRSCFHTFEAPTNWWYVDLQHIYRITEVKVYNRLDCCSNRTRNITLLVGNSLDSLTEVANVPDQIEDIQPFVMPVGTLGRYVKLVQTANEPFHLCEVLVFSPADDINVALNKPANLSNQYTVSYPDVTADKAVDGNTNQDFNNRSCFHTFEAPTNWWYVDLQHKYTLTEVRLYNRLDCCSERCRNITVLVGDSLNTMAQVAHVADQIEDIHSIVMPADTTGRYVKLVQTANDEFHLCEVLVFAPADVNECDTNNGGCDANADCINTDFGNACQCKTGYYGDGKKCSAFKNCEADNGGCDANADCISNICRCKTGYYGCGTVCFDMNACATNNGGCDVNADCFNTESGTFCQCKVGYYGDGKEECFAT